LEADDVEHPFGEGLLLRGGLGAVQKILPEPPAAAAGPFGDEEVLADRHAREELEALKGAPDPEPGPLVDGESGDVAAIEVHGTRVGRSMPSRQLRRSSCRPRSGR